MKSDAIIKTQPLNDLSGFSNEELAEAFIYPSRASVTAEEKQEDAAFWQQRRHQFESRSPQQKMYNNLLQLKFLLEDYVAGREYNAGYTFGHFLNEYIKRQHKPDKQFAAEVDVKPAVLSQYLNDHRKPTEQFIIRLELHANGLISGLTWFKLLQKDKEYNLITNSMMRNEESKHVKNKVQLSF